NFEQTDVSKTLELFICQCRKWICSVSARKFSDADVKLLISLCVTFERANETVEKRPALDGLSGKLRCRAEVLPRRGFVCFLHDLCRLTTKFLLELLIDGIVRELFVEMIQEELSP